MAAATNPYDNSWIYGAPPGDNAWLSDTPDYASAIKAANPTATPAPASAKPKGLNDLFAAGWTPSGGYWTNYQALTGTYGMTPEEANALLSENNDLQGPYAAYQKQWGDPTVWGQPAATTGATEPGPMDALFDDKNIGALTPFTSSYTGLDPATSAMVGRAMQGMSGIPGQYTNLLSSMASPASYISAQRPVQKALNEGLIRDLANKGILSSTQAEQILTESANKIPYSYLQSLQSLAPLFASGVGAFGDLANTQKFASSLTADPLAVFRERGNILTGL